MRTSRRAIRFMGLSLTIVMIMFTQGISDATASDEIGDLLQPFGYRLGLERSAMSAFRGSGSWVREELSPLYGEGSPLSSETIGHSNHEEFYSVNYWKDKVWAISRSGLYGANDTAAGAAFRRLFPAFIESLRALGCGDSVAYSEDFETVCMGKKVEARLTKQQDTVLAQYNFSITDIAAEKEVDAFRASKDKERSLVEKSATHFMAMSECAKRVTGKSGKEYEIRIGLMTVIEGRSLCESVASAKAKNMVTAGWNCTAEEGANHACLPITPAEEELGLSAVRKRLPVMNTYLVFTDLDKHLTQISFWDLPGSVAGPLCETFRQDVMKSGAQDAECILGKS